MRRIAEALALPREQVRLLTAAGDTLEENTSLEAAGPLTVCVTQDPLEDELLAMAGVEDFAGLVACRNLELAAYGLTRLPARFAELAALQRLSLIGNRLEALPESFGQLAALRELDLQRNRLTRLPESFGELQCLTDLDLMDNRLASLPKSLALMGSLRRLCLMYNPLRVFPEVLCELVALSHLNIGRTEVMALPEALGRMLGLTVLGLAWNHLVDLPDSLCRLTSLTSLDLQENPVVEPLVDRHPARFVLAFLCRHGSLSTVRLWCKQATMLPECISKLIPALDAYLERDPVGAPLQISRLAKELRDRHRGPNAEG